MSSEPDGDAANGEEGAPVRTYWRDAWSVLRSRWLFWLSLVLILVFVVMAVAPALFVSPSPAAHDPGGVHCDLREARQGPSAQHWFGTDVQGCDYYAQVTWGARVSLTVSLFTTGLTLTLGLTLGSVAGYFQGWADAIISRVADGFFALPHLVGAIVILSALTTESDRQVWHVSLAMTFISWPALVRLARSTVLQVQALEFVQAARALGASDARIIARHILPNAAAPSLVYATTSLGSIVSLEATLSYLGVGLPVGSISWGIMVAEGSRRVEQSPHLLLFPAIYLTLAALGFVIMGEELREALDPRVRR